MLFDFTRPIPQLPKPLWRAGRSALYHADCLQVFRSWSDPDVDAIVADPPYCSGGMTRGDRVQRSASEKYVHKNSRLKRPEFSGDTRDQRGFLAWSTLWLSEAHRITKPGGVVMIFTDWRQLPIVSDALQAGGWVWRGIVPWDKTEGVRPQRGWFRAQCEYVLVGSKGSLGQEQARAVRVCAPGIFRHSRRAEARLHMTGKPVALMDDLLQVLPPRAHVFDPFAGGGATLLAGLRRGFRVTGAEITREYAKLAALRLDESLDQKGARAA